MSGYEMIHEGMSKGHRQAYVTQWYEYWIGHTWVNPFIADRICIDSLCNG